jgi:hypothetical protein
MPRKKPESVKRLERSGKRKPKKEPKEEKKEGATYKRAKNNRVYKIENGKVRFVSKEEAKKNGM